MADLDVPEGRAFGDERFDGDGGMSSGGMSSRDALRGALEILRSQLAKSQLSEAKWRNRALVSMPHDHSEVMSGNRSGNCVRCEWEADR